MAQYKDQSPTERAVKAYALALYADRKPRNPVLTKHGEVRVFVQHLPEDESRCGQVVVGQFSELARLVGHSNSGKVGRITTTPKESNGHP